MYEYERDDLVISIQSDIDAVDRINEVSNRPELDEVNKKLKEAKFWLESLNFQENDDGVGVLG